MKPGGQDKPIIAAWRNNLGKVKYLLEWEDDGTEIFRHINEKEI